MEPSDHLGSIDNLSKEYARKLKEIDPNATVGIYINTTVQGKSHFYMNAWGSDIYSIIGIFDYWKTLFYGNQKLNRH